MRNAILPMARTGAEPTAAMGVDIPLAVLDDRGQPLFSYFANSSLHRSPIRPSTPSARR
ncbi:MAG: glutamate synthase central domain-containing protein [Intestinimonas sp.]